MPVNKEIATEPHSKSLLVEAHLGQVGEPQNDEVGIARSIRGRTLAYKSKAAEVARTVAHLVAIGTDNILHKVERAALTSRPHAAARLRHPLDDRSAGVYIDVTLVSRSRCIAAPLAQLSSQSQALSYLKVVRRINLIG
jgi:hypothetical protein